MNIEFVSTVAVIASDPAASSEPTSAPLGCRSRPGLWPQRTDRRLQVVRDLAVIPGRRGVLWHAAVAGGASCAAGQHRIRSWGRRGGRLGGGGTRASRIRTAAPGAHRAVGSDGRQATVAGRHDRRHLVHPMFHDEN